MRKISGLYAAIPPGPGTRGLCILHSRDEAKDPEAFKEAIQGRWNHAAQKSYDFREVFFPGRSIPMIFRLSRICKTRKFYPATFTEGADFSDATFTKEADFSWPP